jgi:soluble lytic murein transglycosylase-like protein
MSDDAVLATRRALAAKYAAKYGIATELVCAVIEQESGWNNWAIRYEQGFYDHYVAPMNLSDTAGRSRAFSWGLMQLMGEVAREFGFMGQFLSELCDPDTGVDWGCKKLKKCLDDAKPCSSGMAALMPLIPHKC